MTRLSLRIVALAFVTFVAACSGRSLQLPVPNGDPVLLVTFIEKSGTGESELKEVTLESGSAEYARFQKWVEQNQKGWSPSEAVTPAGGVAVHCGDLHLQFIQTTVYALTNDGHFQKQIREEDYAFLLNR